MYSLFLLLRAEPRAHSHGRLLLTLLPSLFLSTSFPFSISTGLCSLLPMFTIPTRTMVHGEDEASYRLQAAARRGLASYRLKLRWCFGRSWRRCLCLGGNSASCSTTCCNSTLVLGRSWRRSLCLGRGNISTTC
ncbi:hypothetical protein BS78_K007400 [Paspalum vaginatum]|uniref:Uncharacterized protein n=1 Tax=Paspalum vaginatum TaxID=158149 RepID=A0A9W8CGA3_9POAL|nr:hypothetical protein BS78_K007400 [Paspalum vaginatum]